MRIAWNPRFAEERAHFALRHECEDCALFDERTHTCSHEYPTAGHDRASYEGNPEEIVFCKEFELR